MRRKRLPALPEPGASIAVPLADLMPVTLSEISRFQGTCYRAANWIHVGQTTGRTRQNKTMVAQAPPKAVWLYPLCPDYRQSLCAS